MSMYKKLLIVGAILASLAIALFFGVSKIEAQMYAPSPMYVTNPQYSMYSGAPYPMYQSSQSQSPNFASLYPYPTYQQYQAWFNAIHPVQQYPTFQNFAGTPAYSPNPYPVYQNNYSASNQYASYQTNTMPNFASLYPYPTYQQYQAWYNANNPQYAMNGYNNYNYGYNPIRNIMTCALTQIVCSYGQLYCSCNGYSY